MASYILNKDIWISTGVTNSTVLEYFTTFLNPDVQGDDWDWERLKEMCTREATIRAQFAYSKAVWKSRGESITALIADDVENTINRIFRVSNIKNLEVKEKPPVAE